MESEESSKKSAQEISKKEEQASNSSNEPQPVTQTATLTLDLTETGTFRVCALPCAARQTASVIRRLSDREQELWCRRFTPSCLENILNSTTVDDETKAFYRQIETKLKQL